jgi:hypothetical protein
MSAKAILVTGARDWNDAALVANTLRPYAEPNTVLIHGDCIGLDRIAASVGGQLGFQIEPHPANWKKYGRAAGPVRNKEMIDRLLRYKIRYMFAFHDCIEKSKGTKNCVHQAKRMGVTATIVRYLPKTALAPAKPAPAKTAPDKAAPSTDAEFDAIVELLLNEVQSAN